VAGDFRTCEVWIIGCFTERAALTQKYGKAGGVVKIAQERLKRDNKLPEGFEFYSWEAVDGSGSTHIVILKGMVAPLLTKGKNKGRPNWRKGDKSTERTFAVSSDQIKQFDDDYEAETGKCSKCEGGQEWAGWSIDSGHRYRTCSKCKGSGKALTQDTP
jgi:hypothetical protein